ncbi:hypothetical protein OPV22_033721 [Ensete ventricosum]|uniref:Leucine-rich repeat-containing N-terminal plant-type domain-containing protein n=1 Tax=Ensete ventricosum TaxID=4639 RepID=A0AAV8P2I4_ENSVE|nr:hypothetical protein OPV22_033721 [Ensete ventricosum]
MSPLPLLSLLPLLLFFPPCTSASAAVQGPNRSANDPVLQTMTMDPLERDTLFIVMETMSSDREWRSSNPDPCVPGSSWPGIECKPGSDNLLHVTRLDFGAAPNPGCRRNATFPSEVFRLPCLQSIFFFDCFKGAETNLSLPPPADDKATAYASLQQLSLKSNPSLVGAIPSHISSLASLQVLTLSQNQLGGAIPASISELTSLVHLDLSYNTLTGSIPSHIGRLKGLIGLDMSYNYLSGTIPPSIGQLGLLQKLDLSSNSLVGSIPENLGSLSFLVFLALSDNKLSGDFPQGIDKLQDLQYFIMDDNPMFVTLPSQLGLLASLQELRLANSGYTGPIPGSFAWLTNLTTLSLEKNRLTGGIPAGLSALGKLYHLNLSRNLLSGIVPFDVGFLDRLGNNLDLRGNSGLCYNGSESLGSVGAAVVACGDNMDNSSSMPKPLDELGGAPFLLCVFYYRLMCLLVFWMW